MYITGKLLGSSVKRLSLLKVEFLRGIQFISKVTYNDYVKVTCIYNMATTPLIWRQTQI